MAGNANSGRKKGVPNKATQEIIDKLDGLNCDPIAGLAEVARESMIDRDFKTAATAYKELAQYVAPKRKAIEIDMETTVTHEVELLSDEELMAELAELGIDEPQH